MSSAGANMQHIDKPLGGAVASWVDTPLVRPPLRDLSLAGAQPPQERPFAWIGELVGFLGRQSRLIACCVVVALILAAAYILTAAPQFTASTTLLIDTRQSQLFSQSPSISDAQIENALIESQVEVLRSAGLARRAVSDLRLAGDPGFAGRPSLFARLIASLRAIAPTSPTAGSAEAAQDRVVEHFLRSISARRVGLTYIVEIDATAKDPALASRLANGLVSAYLTEQLAVKEHSLEQASGWLETRLAELQSKALKADQAVQAFKSSNGIVDTGRGLLSEQQLSDVNAQLASARARRTDAQAHLDRITQALGAASGPVETDDLLKSPVINGLRERYLADAARVAEWSARYGSNHGAVVNLRKEMGALQGSIAIEMRRIGQAAESDVSVARDNELALQRQLRTMSEQSASTDTSRATLRSLQSVADTYRSLYVTFLQRGMQTAQDESSPVADAHVVTSAHPPLTKSAPKTKLVIAGAIVLGLAVAFATGLLREALDQRLRTPADLRHQTGLAMLASLPTVRGGEPSLQRLAADHPDSAFGIGIRRLQQRLVQHREIGGGGVIGLIAPGRSAGVSTIAANLVLSLVRSGYDAAVLDLSHAHDVRSIIRARLQSAQREHEFVVVDLPSLASPEDAHSALPDLDVIALVLRAATTDGVTLLQTLRDAGIERNLLGVVMNRADQTA